MIHVTVAVSIRVPGQGAVVSVDGRYTQDDHICTDSAKKWFVFGSVAGAWAGSPGGLWSEMEDMPPRNWPELRERVSRPRPGWEYDVLVYDRIKDRLLLTDQEGDVVMQGMYAAIGCGCPIALGVLDAAKAPATLEAAAKLARRAVQIACRRNSACGGRIRTLLIHGRKGPIEVR